ncbi:HAD family hydrolase [Propionibacterium sp.]|uniref:HAD family hydrolase n=1 Tax=Propionibacterium sp. TaxID=1977903 RepID=UPI0039EB4DC1
MTALDIDGTLVDHRGVTSPRVVSAVNRLIEAGSTVVIATGRAFLDVKPIVRQLMLPPGPMVASNGAVVIDAPPMEITRKVTFDPADVIHRVHELAPTACIAVEDIGKGFRLNKLFPRDELHGRMSLESIDTLCASPVTRVIVRDPNSQEQDFLRLADQIGMHGVSYAVGWSAWLDIAPKGVNKATGLAFVADEMGVDAKDVLAVGDGRNDLEMLRWAGRGVAMGDASWEVKEAADDVTANFEDDGAALELERWSCFARREQRELRTA